MPDSSPIILEMVKDHFVRQITSIAEHKRQGVTYVGFSLAILALFGGLGQTDLATAEAIAYGFIFLVVAILFVLLLPFAFGVWYEDVLYGVEPRSLVENYLTAPPLDTRQALLNALLEAITENERVLSRAVQGIDIATILLIVQALLAAGTLAFIRAL